MVRSLLVLALILAGSVPAYAQRSTLSGVVVDSAGGVIPGADVVIRHTATGVTTSGVSNSEGAFSFPGVQTGVYTVTVTLQGFKTFVANDVTLTTGTPASIRAVLDVGGITETVTVQSSSEIIQTKSSTISSTVTMNQISKLPLTSRSAMDFVNSLPGVSTPGGNRQASVNGLPRGMINITLDGVNIQDNTLRTTDGFFSIVSPRLDAIEEVTVTTASQGAGDSGQGAVQVRFVTRSGSNKFTGSLYETYRNDKFDANTWFNNRDNVDKAALRQHQPGGRVGGPIMIPGLFDGRNKAFFFVNYEEFYQPGELTRTRTMLHPRSELGWYRYQTPAGVQEVNVLALAAAAGNTSTMDPTVAALLSKIRAASATSGTVSDNPGDPLLQSYRNNVEFSAHNKFPTFRIDYNVTEAHRLSTSLNYQKFTTFPDTLNGRDPRFPGFPVAAGQSSIRQSLSNSLRSTFGGLVNELRVAYAGAPVSFFPEKTNDMWADQGGMQLNFPLALTSPSPGPNRQGRNAYNWHVENSVNWLKGAHSLTFGGSWTQITLWSYNTNMLPSVDFGIVTGDPAQGMFSTANFPGASAAQLAAAGSLYALLTGRVAQINGDAALVNGKYEYMGEGRQESRMREAGFFVQDSWQWTPNFTVNIGMRYELQFPFTPLNNSYSTATLASLCGRSGVRQGGSGIESCNMFAPGVMPGSIPEYINFGAGERAFNVDWNNVAPTVGFAWQLGQRTGMLGRVLGNDAVIRGGYTRSYSREGMNLFTARFGSNPGLNLLSEPDRNVGNNNLGALPLLYREKERLGPGSFPEAPVYPFQGVATNSINRFDENIQVPSADSWTIGLQRALGANHVIEARYVGTRSSDGWLALNFNEIDIASNGFLQEFRVAQNNLAANLAANGVASFAYTGAAGTAPLPSMLAYLNGSSAATNPGAYTGTNWTNASLLAFLAGRNPNPFGLAGSLNGNGAFRNNALAAGLPANFFVMNPDKLGGANMTVNMGATRYDSLQLELRRRLHNGLQYNASYVFGNARELNFFSFREPTQMRRDSGDPGDLTHALKSNIVWDLPLGRGRRFASNAGPVLDRLLGGWSLSLTSRIQSGRLINLGNVRVVGMDESEVRKLFKLRIDANGDVWMLPQDVIDETVKAFNVSATSASGYGASGAPSGRYFAPANGPDCIEPTGGALIAPNVGGSGFGACGTGDLVVTGPTFQQHDMGISKRIRLFGSTNLELRAEALNVFNQVNFIPVAGVGSTTAANYEVTSLTGTNLARTVQLIGRFNF